MKKTTFSVGFSRNLNVFTFNYWLFFDVKRWRLEIIKHTADTYIFILIHHSSLFIGFFFNFLRTLLCELITISFMSSIAVAFDLLWKVYRKQILCFNRDHSLYYTHSMVKLFDSWVYIWTVHPSLPSNIEQLSLFTIQDCH